MGRFLNKVVVVSGAGSVGPGWGNGRAIAVQMVEEGAHVLALDRDLDRMNETLALAQQAAKASGISAWTIYNAATRLGIKLKAAR